MREYAITDRGGIELLAQACAALDRAESLAEAIAEDGAVIRTRSGPKSHPAAKDELQNRAFWCGRWSGWGSTWKPSRPPAGRHTPTAGHRHEWYSTHAHYPAGHSADLAACDRAVRGRGEGPPQAPRRVVCRWDVWLLQPGVPGMPGLE